MVWVERYVAELQFEWNDSEQPFLFYVGGDTSRNVSSSQWTTMVKECFSRFSPGKVSVPPKLLR